MKATYKADWDEAREAHAAWWRREGLCLWVTAPRDKPLPAEDPGPPKDLRQQWLDPDYRLRVQRHRMAHTFYGGAAYPSFETDIGPGSLGLFLGGKGELAPDTVWYPPTPEVAEQPLRFQRNEWWHAHVAQLQQSDEWLVGFPDLIENLDTLAQLRGPEETLYDLLERPAWCRQKIDEINTAYFEAFEALEAEVIHPWGGNGFCAFNLWGPGRTAKLQCDFSCMISEEMFGDIVVPALRQQCRWLDHSMYHLDGTQAVRHLPALLAIEELTAVEWTPQAGIENGGHERWIPLFRQILEAGKSVQAILATPAQARRLVDELGTHGLYVWAIAESESEARELLRDLHWEGDA